MRSVPHRPRASTHSLPFPLNVPTLLHRGVGLSYRSTGYGPPVLLIQGTGVQGARWQPQIDDLQLRAYVAAADRACD